jgi:hypothetical protein
MTKIATKSYYVGVIERAIAYYDVEAEDARTAAEHWDDGEFSDRDDEALDTEGPCSVRECQPDGSWRKVPETEWKSEAIDFEAERIRNAAPALLAALETIMDYAENEAFSLENLKDSPEAEVEAERAWKAVESARDALALAKGAGVIPLPAETDKVAEA